MKIAVAASDSSPVGCCERTETRLSALVVRGPDMQKDTIIAVPRPACRGVLVVYARGEGECDLRRGCDVYDLRFVNHEAYMAAHRSRVLPNDQFSRL
ncbi:MAG: hypothetical protein QOE62_1502 [Actinomycetota bacterium]|nr:hypothetical protein [Actinomycetota bacterium]